MALDSFVTSIGGATAALYKVLDWESTPLGAYDQWPETLKVLVSSMLGCPIPMYICWGPSRAFLYNDAYSVLLAKKHPNALGRAFEVVWPEVWDKLESLFEQVAQGKNFYFEDNAMQLDRHGYTEEGFFTFSFNPIFDAQGSPAGLQCICYETTNKILNHRAILKLTDVSERARVRAEIAIAELDTFFKNAPVAMALLDGPEHVFKHCNKLYQRFVNGRDLLGLTARKAFPDLEGQPFFGLLDEVYRTGKAFIATESLIVFEYEGRREEAFVDFNYSPRFSEDGSVHGISATVIDVTAQVTSRRIAEKSAQDLRTAQIRIDEEKKKLEIIFENATSAMAMVREPKHLLEKANPSFKNLFGPRVRMNEAMEDLFPELRGGNLLAMLDKTFQTGESYKSYEEKLRFHPDPGQAPDLRYLDIGLVQLMDGNDKIEGVLIDIVDVTERVLSRRKLEESEERLQLATEAAKIGIWELDTTTQRVNLESRAAQIFKLDRAQDISFSEILRMTHPLDRQYVEKSMANALDPSSTGLYEAIHRIDLDDGETRWVSTFGQARNRSLEFPGRTRLTGAIIDITADVLTKHEVISAREAAEEANSAKSAFLSNMSHEIRSPLGAIMGFVELLRENGLSSEERADYIGVIERNSHQLLRIIDDILDLSKVEAGKMTVEQIDFSLLEILADFASLMGFKARDNGIDFILRAVTPLPDPICSDPTRIRQILSNVVGNAIKFTKKGVVELSVSYQAPRLRFHVKDSGIGISTEESSRLFQAFGQADISTTRKFGGTGLGLVLTKKLSQALGGDFWLDSSEVDRGSTFIAEIAIELPDESRMIEESRFKFTTQPIASPVLELGLLKGIRVLVVEDSPDNQVLLRVLLVRYGALVDLAEDGLIGVDKALAGHFDIILMDVQMPRMDGYEAVRILRSKNFTKPIIALTAHAMVEEREKCLQAGYTDFLSKPIDRVKLIDVLKSQLDLDA